MVRFPQAAQVANTCTAQRIISSKRAMYVPRFQSLELSSDSWKFETGVSFGIRLLPTADTEAGWIAALRGDIRFDINVSNAICAHTYASHTSCPMNYRCHLFPRRSPRSSLPERVKAFEEVTTGKLLVSSEWRCGLTIDDVIHTFRGPSTGLDSCSPSN